MCSSFSPMRQKGACESVFVFVVEVGVWRGGGEAMWQVIVC